MTELEVCVDTPEAFAIAQTEHVSRIELCSALEVGGLTPSAGMIRLAAGSGTVPVYAMIRPRSGPFIFSAAEEQVMLADIAAARAAGLTGVVLGASKPDNRLDVDMLQRLSNACGPLQRTLHRAFDLTPDPFEALETAIALGFERILTSGCAPQAAQGVPLLKALVRQAEGRITIMAGSGVNANNAVTIVSQTGVTALHGSYRAATEYPPGETDATRLGFGHLSPLPNPAVIRTIRAELAILQEAS